jgi:hypothetical protein
LLLFRILKGMPQPIETRFRSPQRGRRRLICQEVSDSEDDLYYRHPSHRHRRHSDPWPNRQQQSPPAIHNLLNNVWHKAERATKNVPPSYSTPNLNSQWQSMPNRPPSPPPVSQAQQKAVNSVWNRAQNSSGQNTNFISNVFDRMRQPTGNIIQPSPPPPQNREAVQDFFATRNLPYGLNQPPPPQNREAVGNFNAARNLPYGLNRPPPPQNREAVGNFFATRNLPYGLNQPPPPQNREAVGNFSAARNLPYGLNQPPPPQNREAVGNFIAARNLPYNYNRPPPQQNPEAERNFIAARNVPSGINRPNSAAQNVWNRADYAANNAPPPMFNTAWNQMQSSPPPMNSPWNQMQSSPPPMNSPWNQMQQSAPYPQNPTRILAPFAGSIRPPTRVPAPPSFAGILSQAHSQHSPYAGSM